MTIRNSRPSGIIYLGNKMEPIVVELEHEGSLFLPVADEPTFISERLTDGRESGIVIIAFYDAALNPVTPTAGSVRIEGSPIDGQWHSAGSGDAIVDATTVNAGVATYSVPVFYGPLRWFRADIVTEITGAVFMKCYIWRA